MKKTIADLSPEEPAKFREWFQEFEAQNWDRQIEEDVKAGRLDRLAEEAIRQHRAA